MASTGAISPGTGASVDRDSKNAWSNPSNALASDNSRATTGADGDYTDWLRVTNFDFAGAGLSSGDTINGITVSVERQNTDSDGGCDDSSLRLWDGSAVQGDDKASGTDWPAGSDGTASYGGAADTWNWAGVSADDLLSSGFGVQISANCNGDDNPAVDHITIDIDYTAAAGGASLLLMQQGRFQGLSRGIN